MSRKQVVLLCLAALILVSGFIFIISQNDHAKQSRVMQAFLSTYYSKDNRDILPEEGDAESAKQFFENAEQLYQSLYEERYSQTLTFKAYEALMANRRLFGSERISKDLNCIVKLEKASLKRTEDTHDGRPAYEYIADIKVTFPDGTSQIIPETGSFILKKENNTWFIDSFYVRGELYNTIKKLAGT